MSLCCSELKLVVVLLLLPLAWAAAAAAVANNDGAFLDSEHQEMSTSNTFPNSDCRNISIGQSEKNRSVPPLSSQANPPQLQHHWCDYGYLPTLKIDQMMEPFLGTIWWRLRTMSIMEKVEEKTWR